MLATIRAVAWIQDRFGPQGATSTPVVSFTRSAGTSPRSTSWPAIAAAPGRPEARARLVVPLFGSAADPEYAPDVLAGMLALFVVAERLAATGLGSWRAMLGYSDSGQGTRPGQRHPRLFDTQARLTRWAADHDVRLTLFHGQGGALGQGGQPPARAVLAQAPGSVGGSFQVTEQGEVIFARYGQMAIAKRHLEQVGSAVLLASSARIADRTWPRRPVTGGIAGRIDQAACAAFRALVGADGSPSGSARISPLREIGGLRIGSRPAKRGLDSASGHHRPG